jgi:hypothetical protein
MSHPLLQLCSTLLMSRLSRAYIHLSLYHFIQVSRQVIVEPLLRGSYRS